MARGAGPASSASSSSDADALSPRVRDDGDREFGRPLVDEPVAGLVLAEQPVPAAPTGTASIAITAVSPGRPQALT